MLCGKKYKAELFIEDNAGKADQSASAAQKLITQQKVHGNVVIDAEDSVNIDSHRCLVYGGGKLVALVGVVNLIVVNTADALMICADQRAQEVKKVAAELEQGETALFL